MISMCSYLIKSFSMFCSLVVGLLLYAVPGTAEFLKAGTFTYHDTNQQVAVVVVPQSEDTPDSGFFVVAYPPTPPQLFDPSQLPLLSASSLFLQYDPDAQHFSALYLGKKQFTVRGNFAVLLFDGLVRVALQKRGGSSLLTVAVRSGERQDSLLGFLGMKEVFSFSGEMANMVQPRLFDVEQSGAIQDYAVNAKHQLTLQGAEVSTSFIGLFAQEGKRCLSLNAIIPSATDWSTIEKMSRDELANVAFDGETKARSYPPNALWPLINSSRKEAQANTAEDFVIALSEEGTTLLTLKEHASVTAPDGSAASICKAEPVAPGK